MIRSFLHYANSIYILFLSADSYTISIHKMSSCMQMKGCGGVKSLNSLNEVNSLHRI